MIRPWEPRAIDPIGRAIPHVVLRAVAIPDAPPPPAVIARLTDEERDHAASLSPARRATWIAGRIALAAALDEVGAPRTAILATPRGAPAVPQGFVGSVSHKSEIAMAIAAHDDGSAIGVDVEEAIPPKCDISRRILTDAELADCAARAESERWLFVLATFSIKEAIYKALDPFVGRYVGFKEAELDAALGVTLRLEGGEGPFVVDAASARLGDLFVSTARVRRAHAHDAAT